MRLILSDGTVIEDGRAGLDDNMLWLFFPGWEFWTAADKVRDHEAMKRIIFQYGADEDVYTGFTVCTSITSAGGEISVSLVKG